MDVELVARNQLFIRTAHAGLLADLRNNLDHENPEFKKKKKMGFATYDTPARIKMFQEWDEGIIIPKGTGKMVRDLCLKHGLNVKVIDERTCNQPIDVYFGPKITPLWYQKEAVEAMTIEQQGLVKAGCGAGKSIIGLMFIAKHRQRTLIVVHTSELFQQWQDEIKKNLEGRFTIGVLGNGKKVFGDITVALIQTIVRMSPTEMKEITKRFAIMIGDESHHFGADSYMKLMRSVAAKWQIGLTATPKRKDRKDFVIDAYLGRVFHEISDEDLQASGRLVSCEVLIVQTGRNYDFDALKRDYGAFGSQISRDIERNTTIVDSVAKDVADERTPMVLTERRAHARLLYSMLNAKGFRVAELTGAVPICDRDRIKRQFKNREYDILIANKQIAAEGMDIPSIDSVHFTFYTTNVGLIKQAIGRGRRTVEGKEYCRVWYYRDYVFEKNPDPLMNRSTTTEVEAFKFNYAKVTRFFKGEGFKVSDAG